MRVLIINTSERTGGAAVAASRLHAALTHIGVEAEMLVRDRQTASPQAAHFPEPVAHEMGFSARKIGHFLPSARPEKATFRFGYGRDRREGDGNSGLSPSRRHSFALDQPRFALPRRVGTHTPRRKNGRVDDARHLARDRYLSLGIVLHELPPILRNVPYLPNGGAPRDLSHRIWKKKQRIYSAGTLTFVACSRWLADEARSASLTREQTVVNIPNPIDTAVFAPQDRSAARAQLGLPSDSSLRIVLFVAQRITNLNKGMPYLVEAFRQYLSRYPEHRHNTALFILGGEAEEFRSAFDVPVFTTPYTYDVETIVRIYNAANLFVLPSISENLPNTIMEALACGIPCLGFRIGGIPEMIDHERNGYVAAAKDAEDLSAGLHYLLDLADPEQLSQAAREKVLRDYSFTAVGQRYLSVYQQALDATAHRDSPETSRL